MVAALSWAARLKAGLARTREVLNTPVSGLFARKPGDATVRFEITRENDFCVTLEPRAKVRADKEFLAEVEAICGKGSVVVI